MNVLFLSTDGVLSNERHLDIISRRGSNYMYDTYNQIDKSKISLLNLLINKVNPKIYYTGLWKNQHSVAKINEMVKRAGATWEAVDAVPYLYKVNGKLATNLDEVDACIEKIYKASEFIDKMVILDDRNDWGKYNSSLIRVNYDKGVKPFHIERALDLYGITRKKL